MRESLIALLGEHSADAGGKDVSGSKQGSGGTPLVEAYLPELVNRMAKDAFVSVRKKALSVLASALSRGAVPADKRPRVLLMVLHRMKDDEESVRELAAKTLDGLWFIGAVRSAPEVASELAEVVGLLNAQVKPVLPLGRDFAFVLLLQQLAAAGGGGEKRATEAKRRAGFAAVCEALLQGVLEARERASSASRSREQSSAAPPSESKPSAASFALSLHSFFCALEPSLCVAPGPASLRYINTLQPYLAAPQHGERTPPGGGGAAAAEETLLLTSVLAVVTALLRTHLCPGAARLPKALGAALADAVVALSRQVSSGSVIASSAHVLCILAACPGLREVTALMEAQARQLVLLIAERLKAAEAGSLSMPQEQLLRRALFQLGYLYRYGAATLEAAADSADSADLAPATALHLFLAFSRRSKSEALRAEGLKAAGFLAVARPQLTLGAGPGPKPRLVASGDEGEDEVAADGDEDPEDLRIYSELDGELMRSLHGDTAPRTKVVALAALLGLLQEEEATRQQRQREEAASGGAGGGPLQTKNNEGDSSIATDIIRRYWPRVLRCCASPDAAVRLQALRLVEATVEGGCVVPHTFRPTLIASCCDANREAACLALKVCGLFLGCGSHLPLIIPL